MEKLGFYIYTTKLRKMELLGSNPLLLPFLTRSFLTQMD